MFTHQQTIRYTIVLFLTCGAFLTVQCGPERNQPRPADVAPATVRWSTWEMTSQAEQTLVEQFRETYPQVEFDRSAMNGWIGDILEETTPPDLFNIDAGQELDELISQNRVADLSEVWDQSGLQEQIPLSLRLLSERDGKQFYVPFGFGWVGIYYNKQTFADHGLQPPETWDEFLQICATLYDAGERPLALSGSEPWVTNFWFEYLNLRLNGPAFHRGLLTGREHYNDPRVRTVLETWKQLFDNGYFVESPHTLGSLDMVAALVRNERAQDLTRQKAVMVLADTYNTSQLPTLFLDELDFFRFPIMDPSIPKGEIVYPFGYAVPLGADHVPQATAFLLHLSTPEAQALIAQEGVFSGTTYAPFRQDVDMTLLRSSQRKAIEMLSESDEAIPHMWAAMHGSVWGTMSYEFTRFAREPHDVDIFLEKLEEARERGIAAGHLTQE